VAQTGRLTGGDEDSARVALTLPTAPEFVRLARLTAAGLASQIGFTYDEIEDLRIAVDELCYLIVGPDGHRGTMVLWFSNEGRTITVEARGPAPRPPRELSAFSRRILNAVADHHAVISTNDEVRFELRRAHRDE
jgi:hypothetical protein